jgi:hypothetical protein
MKSFVRFIGYIIATLAIAVAIFFGCWFLAALPPRAQILVINQSGTTLSNLAVSGSCPEHDKDKLAPLAEWHVQLLYHGPIHLSFTSDGKPYVSNPVLSTNDAAFRAIFFLVGSNMVVKIETRS